jgi:hypothetical protein
LLGRAVASDALSEECLALPCAWLQDCLTNHPTCQTTLKKSLPTRVIAVGSVGMEPRLHISNGEQEAYVALSYCWCGETALRTTKDTLAAKVLCIPFADMPLLFQDVLKVVRRLGISYLWIDSLCIIQDSPEDWKSEAATMQHVYSRATLTISVHHCEFKETEAIRNYISVATGPSHGLSSDLRNKAPSIHVGSIEETDYFVRDFGLDFGVRGVVSHSHGDSIYTGFKSELDTRGWCFQESALSSRVLYYNSWEMSWECATLFQCECTPTTVERNESGKTLLDTPYRMALAVRQHGSTMPTDEIWDLWRKFVREYTSRKLSFVTDRLIGIEGLARLVNDAVPTMTYMKGIWKEGPTLLGWQNYESTGDPEGIERCACPSWSWGCMTGPTAFPKVGTKCASLEITRWVPEEGLIEVHGPMCEVVVIQKDNGYHVSSVNLPVNELTRNWTTIQFDVDKPPLDANPGMHYLLRLWDNKNTGDRDSYTSYCVVLQRSEARGDCYTRIGRYVLGQPADLDMGKAFADLNLNLI